MWFVVAWCGLSLHGKTDPTFFLLSYRCIWIEQIMQQMLQKRNNCFKNFSTREARYSLTHIMLMLCLFIGQE